MFKSGEEVVLLEDYNEGKAGDTYIFAFYIKDSGYDCSLLIKKDEKFKKTMDNFKTLSFLDYLNKNSRVCEHDVLLRNIDIDFTTLKPLSKNVSTKKELFKKLEIIENELDKTKDLLRKANAKIENFLGNSN